MRVDVRVQRVPKAVRSNAVLVIFVTGISCGLKHELNLDGVKRKNDSAAFGAVQNAGVQQCRYVTMDRLDITSDAASRLADGHRTNTTKYLQQFPSLCGEDLPKQLR